MNVSDLAQWNLETNELEEEVSKLMERITGAPTEPETTVRLNFPTSPDNPFRKSERSEKRLKVFLWGPSGAGKTVLSLRFPKPAVLDLERGSEQYGESFDFDVMPATTADEITAAVDWLIKEKHEYRTLIIDPITIYWEALQKKWSDTFLKRNKGGRGHKFEFYEMQPRDWNTVKAEWKELIRKLLALDMNVIVTARSKILYEEGTLMRASGETFDGEKSLPYLFDIVLHQWRSPDGKFMAETIKDRTNKLPIGQWEIAYEKFEEAFGARQISKKATPILPSTQAQRDRIVSLAKEFGMADEKLNERIQSYGAESIDELTKQNAEIIVKKLEDALARKHPTSPVNEKEKNDAAA